METFSALLALCIRGIHRWPVNSLHKGQWRRALIFSLICAWINDWVNNREAGDLRRHRAHYDFTAMTYKRFPYCWNFVIPLTECRLCGSCMFSLLSSEQAVEQTLELPVIWDTLMLITVTYTTEREPSTHRSWAYMPSRYLTQCRLITKLDHWEQLLMKFK